jgi:hypothetical protein
LDLQSKGSCDFRFDELLFDEDYPGHYARQIKSISITIPAVVGPYQNFKATLTQLGNQILIKPDIDGVDYLLGGPGGGGIESSKLDSSILRSNWRANQKIAISKGAEDRGIFALNFNDERYLPFEGTGAISSWRLNMPKANNRLNYDNMSDVIIQLQYTACDGGETFASEVTKRLTAIPYRGQRAFNLGVAFSSAWYAFMHPAEGAEQQSFVTNMERNYFPANLTLGKITALYVQLDLAEGKSLGGTLTANLGIGSGNSQTLTFDDNHIIAELSGLPIVYWVDRPWTITVKQSDVPLGIRDSKTEFIDPEALRSMALLISYEAQRPSGAGE